MDKASKPIQNQNGAGATGRILKLFKDFAFLRPFFIVESLAGRYRSRF